MIGRLASVAAAISGPHCVPSEVKNICSPIWITALSGLRVTIG